MRRSDRSVKKPTMFLIHRYADYAWLRAARASVVARQLAKVFLVGFRGLA